MKEKKLRDCPFCHYPADTYGLGIGFNKLMGKYTFFHSCKRKGIERCAVGTHVTGNSVEEVIDIWNGEADMDDPHIEVVKE